MQGQGEGWGPEHGPMLGHLQLVRRPGVIEARLTIEHEPHLPPDYPNHPDYLMMGGDLLRVVDRHEVDDLSHPCPGHKPGDQDGRLGEIELLGHIVVTLGGDPEGAATLDVEQGGKDAGSVEAGGAVKVNGAIGGDQRCRLQIADHTVIRNLRILLSIGFSDLSISTYSPPPN